MEKRISVMASLNLWEALDPFSKALSPSFTFVMSYPHAVPLM